jgi:plasmid stabilization system protein ParE
MSLEVLITERAQQEAQANHDWWAEHRSVEQAARWYDEFLASSLSLEDSPDRRPLALESDRFPFEIRQLNFGIGHKPTHRLIYTVRSDQVVILRVRHLAQQEIEPM